MKHLYVIVLISLPIYMFGQNNNTQLNKTTLSGAIEHHDGTVLKIYDTMGKGSWYEPIPVEEDLFSIHLTLTDPAIKKLIYGDIRKDIFLEEGKSLYVSFDAEDIENTFRFGGDLERENSLLDSISVKSNSIDYSYIYSQPLELATQYLDSFRTDCKAYLATLFDHHKTSSVFEKYVHASVDYQVAYLKILLGERQDEQYPGYYDFLNDLDIEDASLLDVPDYRIFLYFYMDRESTTGYNLLDSIQQNATDARFIETLQTIEHLENDAIRSYCLYNAMLGQLKEQGITGFDSHYNYFRKKNTDANYAEQLKLAYEEKKRIAPGQVAPSFTLEDIDGHTVSLEDFTGKYVYLDFWLTTCPRSARELPSFLNLYSDYRTENIAFISISPDRDKNTWMNYVKEKRNVGTCLWSDKFLDSQVFDDYQVYGTPSYVLIDTNGKIIDPVAPKPSSTEIRIILDQLLKND